MKAPNLCDVCKWPKKPVYGTIKVEMRPRAFISYHYMKLELELCEEHYKSFKKAMTDEMQKE